MSLCVGPRHEIFKHSRIAAQASSMLEVVTTRLAVVMSVRCVIRTRIPVDGAPSVHSHEQDTSSPARAHAKQEALEPVTGPLTNRQTRHETADLRRGSQLKLVPQ
jgi:hypothetical protein